MKYQELLKQATPLPYRMDVDMMYAPGTLCVVGDPKHGQPGFSGCCIARVAPPESLTEQDKANAALLAHSANTLPQALEALKKAAPLLRQSLEAHNAALKDADAESQFYGEDICTPPVLSKVEQAIAAIENVNV